MRTDRYVTTRLYDRLSSWLLPASFRADWRQDLVETVCERREDAAEAGSPVMAVFWLREFASLVGTALSVRLAVRRANADAVERGDEIRQRDTRPLRFAWIAALVVHFVAFTIVVPVGSRQLDALSQREVIVIRVWQPPKPPPDRPKKHVVKKRVKRVPFPDPTPFEPDPVFEETEIEWAPVDTADVDFSPLPPPAPPFEPGPQLVRVGVEVQRPRLLHRVDPEYTALARRARLECIVILEARIEPDGTVSNVTPLRGCGLGLDESAIGAVSEWRYMPTTLDGRPVAVLLTATIRFHLN